MAAIPVPAATIVPTDAENGICTGQLDGDFATTSDGAATFRVPLWVPPGRNGMAPELALVYDSRASDGLLGVGWSLSGIRTITRSRCRFLDGDGPVRPVRFDSTDHFTLDGQPLVLVGGKNAIDGAEYRTRRESFSRITVKGSDELGPLTFELRSKDGRILTFGADDPVAKRIEVVVTDGNTQQQFFPVRYSWSLRRIQDRDGNYIEIDYGVVIGPPGSTLAGEFLPTQIRYTGFGATREGLAPTKSVRFFYGGHPEASATYVAGLEIRRAARLERIEMWGPDPTSPQLLRLYELTYRASAISGRSLLHTIRECDGWPSVAALEGAPLSRPPRGARPGVCKRPLVFEWERGSPGFSEPFQQGLPSLFSSPDITSHLRGRLIPADLNGDGCDDLICMIPVNAIKPNEYSYDLYYAFIISNGDDLGYLQITPRVAPSDMRPRPLDFDMDGQIELMMYDVDTSGSPPRPRTVLSRIVTDPVTNIVTFNDVQSFPLGDYDVADFDGGGLASLILPIDAGSFWRNVDGAYFDGPQPLPVPPIGDRRVVGVNLAFDIDGDGAMELLCPRYKTPPSGGVLLVPGELTAIANLPPDGLPYTAVSPNKPSVKVNLLSGQIYVFADLNGDGLLDAITFDPSSSSPPPITVVINTGNGYVYVATQTIPTIDFRTAQIRAINYCGDGKQQLLVRPFTGLQDDPMRVLRWNGKELIDIPLSTHTLWTDGASFKVIEVLDATGNGLDDFAMLNQLRPVSQPTSIGDDGSAQVGFSDDVPRLPPALQLYRRLGKKPDMLVGITNALGAKRTIVYEPLTSRNVYSTTKPTAYPLYAARSKLWVVAQTLVSDGRGGNTVLNYRYEDGRLDLLGDGFLGFCAHEVSDAQTGTTTRTEFDPSMSVAGIYPLAGLPVNGVTTWNLGGGLQRVRNVHTDYIIRTDPTDQAVFPFASSVRESESEVDSTTTNVIYDRTTTQDFDSFGNRTLLQTVWPDGSKEIRRTSFSPDETQWLISLVDVEQVVSMSPTAVRANKVAYTYDALGHLTDKVLNPGKKVGGQYQPLPLQADGLETLYVRYFYNAEGTLRRLEAAPSPTAVGFTVRSIDITYDDDERCWPVSIVNAAGHLTQMAIHAGIGVLAIYQDVNGHSSQYQYDHFGRIKRQSAPGGEDVAVNYFLQLSLPAGVPGVDVSQCEGVAFASGPQLVNVFDTRERVVATRSLTRSDGKVVLRSIRFDAMGRLAGLSRPYFQTDTPRWSTFTYDVLSRVRSITYANGAHERFEYNGRLITWTNPRNRSTTCTFDDRDRLTQQVETSAASASVSTIYEYGPFSTLELVVNAAGMPIRIIQDRLGRVIRVHDPNAHEERLGYNAFGDLNSVVRGGHSVALQYDNLGRIRQVDAPEGNFVYSWDTSTNGVGLLASCASPDGVCIDYKYDAVSRPHSKLWTVEGLHLSLDVEYDAAGRLLSVRYPDLTGPPVGVGYEYGAFGELVNVLHLPSGKPLWSRLDSDASGSFSKNLLGNGVTSESIEDTVHPGMLSQIRDRTSAGVDVQNLVYRFDAELNLVERIDSVTKAREVSAFDSLNRLVEWNRSSTAGSLKIKWLYDDVGNVVSAERWPPAGGSGTLLYAYGAGSAGPQAVSSTGSAHYSYDAMGNQTSAPGRSITFTSFGLPLNIASSGAGNASTFKYDAELHRIASNAGAGKHVVSLPGLYEYRSHDHSEHLLVSVRGTPVAQIGRRQGVKDEITYLHTDHLGSLQATTDAAAAPIGLYRNEPFGRSIDPKNPSFPPQASADTPIVGFAGHTTNAEAGLIDMRGRWYDPKLARFLSPDPFRPMPSRSQRQNAYSYSLNNPLTWSDPTGLDPEQVDDQDVFFEYYKQYLREHPDDSIDTLNDAVDWAHQQMTAASSVPNETGWGAAGVSASLSDSNPASTVFSSSGVMVPDFNEPPSVRPNVRSTITPRQQTSGLTVAQPAQASQLLHNNIDNLIDLLEANGLKYLTYSGRRNEVRIAAPYEKVRQVLEGSFYSGIWAWNPINHPGGKEFRTLASPGFHFKLADSKPNEPTRITDLHIDLNNPLIPDSFFSHVLDFLRFNR
jgi:RHS repeat-associated protein